MSSRLCVHVCASVSVAGCIPVYFDIREEVNVYRNGMLGESNIVN